jgi:hypothetical protein
MGTPLASLLAATAFAGGMACGIILENQLLQVGRPIAAREAPDLASRSSGPHSVASGGASGFARKHPREQATVPATFAAQLPAKVSPSEAAQSLARIAVDESTFQFGDRQTGEIVEHVFVISNIGDSTLKIEKVLPSCGCTIPDLVKREVPPGEQTELRVRLDLAMARGPQHRSIVVHSNDPTNSNLKLTLAGNAVTQLQLIPSTLTLQDVPGQPPPNAVVRVMARYGLRLDLLELRTSGDHLEAESEVVKPGEEFNVRIACKRPLPVGTSRGWVHVLTDHPGEFGIMAIPVVVEASACHDGGPADSATAAPAGAPVSD